MDFLFPGLYPAVLQRAVLAFQRVHDRMEDFFVAEVKLGVGRVFKIECSGVDVVAVIERSGGMFIVVKIRFQIRMGGAVRAGNRFKVIAPAYQYAPPPAQAEWFEGLMAIRVILVLYHGVKADADMLDYDLSFSVIS